MKNIEHLCRICVRESHFFKNIYNYIISDDCIVKIINTLCDLNISEGDGLPEYICGECYGKLLEIQKFKKMCHDGMAALISLKTKYSEIKREKPTNLKQLVVGEVDGSASQKPCSSQLSEDEPINKCAAILEERAASDLAKQIAVNEIYIKTEPVEEVEEILPSDGDDEEVIIPRVRAKAVRTSIPSYGVIERPVINGQVESLSPPTVMKTGCSISNRDGQYYNQIDDSWRLKFGQVGTSQTRVRMDAEAGVQANNSKAPVRLKQKALLITDPDGQGNVVLQKMGPNKFLPLMVTKQPLILLQSPGNPGVVQAAYVKQGGAPVLHHHPAPLPLEVGSVVGAAAPVTESAAEREEEEQGGEGGRVSSSPPSIVQGDMGVSYLCMTVPSDHRPYMCETCGKCFRRGLHLRYHRSTHRDERPFTCTECGKSFKLKTILTTHMMTHSQEPPRFACDHCEKKFPTRARLKYHQVVHSSERNFECHECCKRFKTKHQLSVHLRTHLSRDLLFSCPTCDQKFKQLIGLRKHRSRLGH